MSIYFRSSLGITFPKSPYIGQVHYDPDLKRTFRYEEKDFGDLKYITKALSIRFD